ncbi:hypothetical protein FQN52_006188 [Onygenales sp. PD_12]|nr:hypothetical protein FQN52_006188 [Onygenales sp. PD_12]KAK2807679.1 hypothetical protein FQN51_000116 [Onygenales sp. PD_10]
MSSISRKFSSTARALLQFIWKGTEPIPKYEDTVISKVKKNTKLTGADRIEIAGGEHDSVADPKLRVSGQVFEGNRRLTSIHAYHDGTVVYSKEVFNKSQEE